MGVIILVIVVVLCIGGLPNWGYHQAGYYPSGGLALIGVVLLILLLMGRL